MCGYSTTMNMFVIKCHQIAKKIQILKRWNRKNLLRRWYFFVRKDFDAWWNCTWDHNVIDVISIFVVTSLRMESVRIKDKNVNWCHGVKENCFRIGEKCNEKSLNTVRIDSCVPVLAMDFCCVRWIHSDCQRPYHDVQNWWLTCANFSAICFFLFSTLVNVTRFFSIYDYLRCFFSLIL